MYDFTTLIDRRRVGSSKWNAMLAKNPDVADDVIPFSVADMELKNPPEIIDGLKEFLADTVLGYSVATVAYRDAVCSWMRRRHGWKIEPEWIVECDGVIPALFAAVNAFTKPGEGVVMLTPVYYPFYSAVKDNGRRVAGCGLVERDGRYEIDYEKLEDLAKEPANKVLLFCSPHNPVGRVWSREELETVGRICLAHNVVIISDEIHFDLVLPGHRHTVFSTLGAEIAERCVVCTAPSKTFNLAGLQASNIIIKNDSLRRRFVAALSKTGFFSLNILGYKACEIAYTKCERWLEELLLHIEGNRIFVEEYMREKMPVIRTCPLEGTYLQWWDCRGMGMDGEELERFMEREAVLFLDEGYIFGEGGEGFERINLACPREKLVEGVERLRAALAHRKLIE